MVSVLALKCIEGRAFFVEAYVKGINRYIGVENRSSK